MPKPFSVAVVGASGMLGRHVVEEVQSRGHNLVTPTVRLGKNWTSSQLLSSWESVEATINCSGLIPLRESSPERMINANSIGPWQLAEVARSWGTRLVHMSTDCVFSGKRAIQLLSYGNPDPTDLYGRSKLAGEPWGENIVVARGSFIGPDHGFLHWLLHTIGSVEAWTKVTWNGSSVRFMARALVDLAEGDQEGIVHVAAEKHVTKAWMVEYLVEKLNLPIDSISLSDKPSIWRALEPDIVLPPVKDSLDGLIEELKSTEEEWNPAKQRLKT